MGRLRPADQCRRRHQPRHLEAQLGLKANDANVQAAYAFYQHLWDSDTNLQWAGMAKLAGAPVFGGLEDMYVLSQLPPDKLVQLAAAGSPLAAFVIQYGVGEVPVVRDTVPPDANEHL